MDRIRKLHLLEFVVILGFIFSITYHGLAHFVYKFSYPYDTFIFRPNDIFMDFIWPFRIAADPYTIARADFQNFPFLYVTLKIFRILRNEIIALGIYLFLWINFSYLYLYRNLKQNKKLDIYFGIAVFTLLSYPFLISLSRANLEFLVFFFICLFIIFYPKNRLASVFFLSLAIAMKPFPAVFLILFLLDHRFQELLWTIGLSAAITFVSYWILPGNVVSNINGHLRNLALYNQVYTVGNEGLIFGNSLWGAFKYIQESMNPWMKIDYSLLTMPYMAFVAILFLLLIGFMWKRKVSFEEKIILCICSMNLFPYVSGDYKLLYFYIPIMMFINNQHLQKSDWIFGIFWGLLLVPKNYFNIPELPEANISVLINPLLMVALCTTVIVTNMKVNQQVYQEV